jgi:hypothetical protein
MQAMIEPISLTMLEGSLQCLDQAALCTAVEAKVANILSDPDVDLKKGELFFNYPF